MSELGDIESAVIGLIQAIQVSSADLFAEVKGFSNTAARDVVAGLRRELKPAAYVVYDGRASSDAFSVPGNANRCASICVSPMVTRTMLLLPQMADPPKAGGVVVASFSTEYRCS